MNRKYITLFLAIPLFLAKCGGMSPEDLQATKSDITSIIEGQAASSEQGVELRSILNEIHTTLSRISGYTPNDMGIGGVGKAFHTMSGINSALRILTGATATDDDVRQFINSQIGNTNPNSSMLNQPSAAYFDNIFSCHRQRYGRNLVITGLGPSIITKLLNVQAKYAAISIQYMVQLIPSMGKDQIKTTLGMAKSARDALNKEYIVSPDTVVQPGMGGNGSNYGQTNNNRPY